MLHYSLIILSRARFRWLRSACKKKCCRLFKMSGTYKKCPARQRNSRL